VSITITKSSTINTLVILAGGNGSRFGGAKQFARFGLYQKTLMEYNINHAIEAGFEHVVFITQANHEAQLHDEIITHLPKEITGTIVIQALTELPSNCHISQTRNKPLGTAHALWCARSVVKSNFAVINADDYYGRSAFFLIRKQKLQSKQAVLVAYLIKNTLSEHGGVNRGLCENTTKMDLININEVENIQKNNGIITGEISITQEEITIDENSQISMNFWGFTSEVFPALEQLIISTLTQEINDKTECYLPAMVMQQLINKALAVKVLTSHDDWFGVTYKADSDTVNRKISVLIEQGIFSYPTASKSS